MLRTLIVAGALSASVASADIASWSWTISDTGDGDGLVEPGESVLLSLWIGFEPQAVGVSEAGPYAITGDNRWAMGTVEDYANRLDLFAFGDGTLDINTNAIRGIYHFQLPPFFGTDYVSHNPVEVYSIRWKPDSYEAGSVTLGNGRPDVWINTDDFGERELYDGAGGVGMFFVVPAPTTAAVFAFGVLGWARRRRLPAHPR